MAIHKNAGSKLFISLTALNPDTVNALTDENAILLFEAINDWVEVEEVEDFGELGDSSEAITFTAVGNRRVRKLKGPRDAGTQTVTVGRDPLDDGQEALVAAEGLDFNYPFKIEMDDARSPSYSKSVLYYGGLVMTKPTNLGNVSNVVRRSFQIGINTAVYEVASGNLSVPAVIIPPSISYLGDDKYRVNLGTYSNDPTSFAIKWQEDDTGWEDIVGGTTQEITYAGANDLRVTVTPSNAAGAGSGATSLAVSPAA
jgi:hypothetical protein